METEFTIESIRGEGAHGSAVVVVHIVVPEITEATNVRAIVTEAVRAGIAKSGPDQVIHVFSHPEAGMAWSGGANLRAAYIPSSLPRSDGRAAWPHGGKASETFPTPGGEIRVDHRSQFDTITAFLKSRKPN